MSQLVGAAHSLSTLALFWWKVVVPLLVLRPELQQTVAGSVGALWSRKITVMQVYASPLFPWWVCIIEATVWKDFVYERLTFCWMPASLAVHRLFSGEENIIDRVCLQMKSYSVGFDWCFSAFLHLLYGAESPFTPLLFISFSKSLTKSIFPQNVTLSL